MLIPSSRHTRDDLALWTELEAADACHAASRSHNRKVEESCREIVQTVSRGGYFCCVSGGKDSSVLVSLLDQCGLLHKVACVWMRAVPKHNPDCPSQLNLLQQRFPQMQLHVFDYESPVPDRMTPLETDRIATMNFHAACETANREYGTPITGIRGDESRARLLRLATLGFHSSKSFCPIGWWTLSDVYAHAHQRNVPLHPAYGMLGGGRYQRHRLRVDALFGERGDGSGRAEWEQEYYGDVLNRLTAASRTRS